MALDLTEFYKKKQTERSIVSFVGTVTPETISITMQSLEEKLEHLKEGSKVKKKIYNIFLECFQNLYHHAHCIEQDKTEKNPSSVCIVDNNADCYDITTGNYIKNDKIEGFQNHLNKVNQFSKEELKDYYMEILNNGHKSEKDGAGLGMIDIVRRADHKLWFSFIPVDTNYSLFSLNIKIFKQ